METLEAGQFTFEHLAKFNIILGKNGCGKSTALRSAETSLGAREGIGLVRYISPERAGVLTYEPGVDQNLSNQPRWLLDIRRANQVPGFKQQSAALFRRLELEFLRRLQRDHILPDYVPRHFQQIIDKINELLDRVEIRPAGNTFDIYVRGTDNKAAPESISSGESELISLGIEVLSFADVADEDSTSFLPFDEPDVHLHPDLQDRFASFLRSVLHEKDVQIIMATHSTSYVSALSLSVESRVAFMRSGMNVLDFQPITDVTRKVLPIFGAHPLSNVFNASPILIVEGEDDRRIWEQSVRSAEGRISIYPCVAGSVGVMNDYETRASEIIQAVYDNARGYSLRDRDDNPEEIDDILPIIRARLSCRTAENLILADESLSIAETDWPSMQQVLTEFIGQATSHPKHTAVAAFANGGLDRKNANLKDIRNVLTGMITSKPWEVLVGQAIARAAETQNTQAGSIRDFLGHKACVALLP